MGCRQGEFMKNILVLLAMCFCALAMGADKKVITLTSENSISFNQAFTSSYIAKKQVELLELLNTSNESDFYVVLYSPGGSISAGSLFIDTIKATGKNVHTITIFSASMAYQTVQALGTRYILPSGTLMSHRGYVSGLSGQVPGELNARVNMIESTINQMEYVSAARVKIPINQYRSDIQNELWLVGEDAVKRGHADEVALAKCDKSLSGTYIDTVMTMFGPVSVEFANCPLITGFLSVKFGSNEAVDHLNKYFENILNQVDFRL